MIIRCYDAPNGCSSAIRMTLLSSSSSSSSSSSLSSLRPTTRILFVVVVVVVYLLSSVVTSKYKIFVVRTILSQQLVLFPSTTTTTNAYSTTTNNNNNIIHRSRSRSTLPLSLSSSASSSLFITSRTNVPTIFDGSSGDINDDNNNNNNILSTHNNEHLEIRSSSSSSLQRIQDNEDTNCTNFTEKSLLYPATLRRVVRGGRENNTVIIRQEQRRKRRRWKQQQQQQKQKQFPSKMKRLVPITTTTSSSTNTPRYNTNHYNTTDTVLNMIYTDEERIKKDPAVILQQQQLQNVSLQKQRKQAQYFNDGVNDDDDDDDDTYKNYPKTIGSSSPFSSSAATKSHYTLYDDYDIDSDDTNLLLFQQYAKLNPKDAYDILLQQTNNFTTLLTEVTTTTITITTTTTTTTLMSNDDLDIINNNENDVTTTTITKPIDVKLQLHKIHLYIVAVLDGFIQLGQLQDAENVFEQFNLSISNNYNSNNGQTIISSTNCTIQRHHTNHNEYDPIYIRMVQAWADNYRDDYLGTSGKKAERTLRSIMSIIMNHTTATNTITPVSIHNDNSSTLIQHPSQQQTVIKNDRRRGDRTTSRRKKINDSKDRVIHTASTDLYTSKPVSKTTISTIISDTAIVKLWTIVIDGWAKRAGITPNAIVYADTLLQEMENNVHSFIRPNVLTYTSVICGLSRSKLNDMAQRAEQLLDRMKVYHIQPDMVTYAAVINCWSKAVSRRERMIAANRAIRIVSEMERLYISKKIYSVKPSTLTYSSVLAAIGNSLDPAAGELAESILQRMTNLHESGTIVNVKPNTATYNAVIFALGRDSSTTTTSGSSKRLPSGAARAEKLLYEMTYRSEEHGERDVQPDVRTWAFVLRAWTRSKHKHAAENAQRILDQMEYRYAQGLSTIRPNYVCYTTVMGGWGYSKSKNALDKMEQLLKRMEDGYEQTLEPDIRPNTVSYVTCIDAFVGRNEPDAAQRAQATVDRMMQLYAKGLGHVRPTRPVFDVLIQAWSRSKDKNAAYNAEKIFHWMEQQYQAGDTLVRPNEITICAVLNAWANQAEYGGAARALQIWEHTNSVASQQQVDHIGFRSTIAMANIVIKAIARSKDPDAVQKAEQVLMQLEEQYHSGMSYVRPDVTTYSSVINACAYCVGNAVKRAEALETALRTFYRLRNNHQQDNSNSNKGGGGNDKENAANNITYGTLFKAIQNLMPISEERIELVRTLFDMCSEDGCVDYFVLSQVRYASPQLYRDLVEGNCGLGGPGSKFGIEAVLKNIPTEWTANTVE